MIQLILQAVWFILPAYLANAAPAIISKTFLIKKSPQIDFGVELGGKPLLGAGKTWIGLLFGILVGLIVGMGQSIVPFLPQMTVNLALLLAVGALVGDLVGSLIKRRLNMKRGAKAPLLDQLDFLIGAFIFSAIVMPINWYYFAILIVLTPVVHLGANFAGWKMGLKKEPW